MENKITLTREEIQANVHEVRSALIAVLKQVQQEDKRQVECRRGDLVIRGVKYILYNMHNITIYGLWGNPQTMSEAEFIASLTPDQFADFYAFSIAGEIEPENIQAFFDKQAKLYK